MSGVFPAPTDPNRRPRPPRHIRLRRHRGHWIRFCLAAAPDHPGDGEERHDRPAVLPLIGNAGWRAALRRIAERGDVR
jgi:hypothetical protein